MSRHRGSVLLLTLWAVSVLSVLAIAQATRISLQLRWAGRLDEARQAWYLAWAATEAAGEVLASDSEPAWDALKEPWGKVPADPIHWVSSGWLRYRIQDEQSRIPLNRVTAEQAARLPGFNPQTAQELVSRRDAGKPVNHLGELFLLTDFPAEPLEELAGLVTVYGSGPVNLNTAPAPVLIRLGLSPSLAGQIAAFRLGQDGQPGTPDDGVFPAAQEVIPVLEEQLGPLQPEDQTALGNLLSSQMIGVGSSLFQVEAEGWVQQNGIHAKVIAVMERTGPDLKAVVRGWREI